MKYLASSILALVGMAIVAPSAHAQVSYTAGDLLVGFANSSATYDYVVDIGASSLYQAGGADATGSPVLILSGSALAADMSAAGVSSGVLGVFGDTSTNVFGTQTESSPGTQTSPLPGLKSSAFGTTTQQVTTFANTFATGTSNANNYQALGTQPNSVIQSLSASNPIGGATPNNYVSYTGFTGQTAFNYYVSPFSAAYAPSTNSGVLDLYQSTKGGLSSPGAVAEIGEFQFNNGALYFDSASPSAASFPLTAVPEPASMFFGLGMIGACAFRRSRKVVAA